jgi:threonine dehydrogenase-like Zn-dependent dehydrogenase
VFEAAGIPGRLQQALEVLNHAGRLVIMGGHDGQATVSIPRPRPRLARHSAPATRPKRLTEIAAVATHAAAAIDARSRRVTGLAQAPRRRRR